MIYKIITASLLLGLILSCGDYQRQNINSNHNNKPDPIWHELMNHKVGQCLLTVDSTCNYTNHKDSLIDCILLELGMINTCEDKAYIEILSFLNDNLTCYMGAMEKSEGLIIATSNIRGLFEKIFKNIPKCNSLMPVLLEIAKDTTGYNNQEHLMSGVIGFEFMFRHIMPIVADHNLGAKYESRFGDMLRKRIESGDNTSYNQFIQQKVHPELYNMIRSDYESGILNLIFRRTEE